jgi:importin subunit alpha-6/7
MERFENRIRSFQKYDDKNIEFKRQQFAVDLRKRKRLDAVNKSRKMNLNSMEIIQDNYGPTDSFDELEIEENNPNFSAEVPRIHIESAVITPDTLNILVYCRTFISTPNYPLEEFATAGNLYNLMSYAVVKDHQEIKSEALWILCNIASGSKECVEELVKYNAIDVFMQSIQDTNPDIVEHCIWGLGNIIADGRENFIKVYNQNFIPKLQNSFKSLSSEKIFKVTSWTLKNISHYESLLDARSTITLIEIVETLVKSTDLNIQTDSLWSIAFLLRTDNMKIEVFLESNIFKDFMKYLEYDHMQLPALRIIGNICSGTNLQTQKILDMQFLDKAVELIKSNNSEVIKEIYWILSNIAAGSTEQISFLESHPIFYPSLNGLIYCNDPVRVEASYFIYNYIKLCTSPMKKKLFDYGVMKIINEALEFKNPQFLINLLDVYESYIIENGAESFVKNGYHRILDDLQTHNNPEIYKRCIYILEKYLGVYEEYN